jgi:hypothetical protein
MTAQDASTASSLARHCRRPSRAMPYAMAPEGAPSAIGHRGSERGSHQLLLNLGQVREHGQR